MSAHVNGSLKLVAQWSYPFQAKGGHIERWRTDPLSRNFIDKHMAEKQCVKFVLPSRRQFDCKNGHHDSDGDMMIAEANLFHCLCESSQATRANMLFTRLTLYSLNTSIGLYQYDIPIRIVIAILAINSSNLLMALQPTLDTPVLRHALISSLQRESPNCFRSAWPTRVFLFLLPFLFWKVMFR